LQKDFFVKLLQDKENTRNKNRHIHLFYFKHILVEDFLFQQVNIFTKLLNQFLRSKYHYLKSWSYFLDLVSSYNSKVSPLNSNLMRRLTFEIAFLKHDYFDCSPIYMES
jgi:hypothetical protein